MQLHLAPLRQRGGVVSCSQARHLKKCITTGAQRWQQRRAGVLVRCSSQRPPGSDDVRVEALLQRVLKGLERDGRVKDPTRVRGLLNQALAWQQKQQDPGPEQPGGPKRPKHDNGGDDEDSWGIFSPGRYQQGWQVPWGAKETVGGMALWAGGFAATGIVVVPLLAYALKLPGLTGGTADDKALLVLFNQVLETAVGLAAIGTVVTRSGPLPDDSDLFVYDPSGPFRRPDGWLAWGLTGISLAPLVILAVGLLLSAVSYDDAVQGGRGTVDAVAGMIQMTPVSFASLLAVTAVLAPVLEEAVFRGFLLTSLTKFMPTPAAVTVSALAFGMAHLSVRDFPQLFALGIVLGFSYVRSRNLLTPMFVHAAWNGTVLTTLFLLTAAGVDIQSILSAR